TLSQGVYRINPWFARVHVIPTRDLILEWTKRRKSDDNYDVALDQVQVNVDGHWVKFDMSQTIRIPAKAAPGLVGRFGEQEAGTSHPQASPTSNRAPVQRFVERVLGRLVENYFHSAATGKTVQQFLASHDEICLDLADQVREALKTPYGVEAIQTTINEFETENELNEWLRERARLRDRDKELEWTERNAHTEARIERIKIEVEGERSVAELRAQLELLGRDIVATRLFLAELKTMGVPSWVSGDANALLDALPVPVALRMIKKA